MKNSRARGFYLQRFAHVKMVFISQGRGRGNRGRGRGGVGEVAFQHKPAPHPRTGHPPSSGPGRSLDEHKTKVAISCVDDSFR